MKQQFIVGEVSKNWRRQTDIDSGLISRLFEQIIQVNLERGYRLHSFNLNRAMIGQGLDLHFNETIVAVFELKDGAQ